jgi:hypothetical protein
LLNRHSGELLKNRQITIKIDKSQQEEPSKKRQKKSRIKHKKRALKSQKNGF